MLAASRCTRRPIPNHFTAFASSFRYSAPGGAAAALRPRTGLASVNSMWSGEQWTEAQQQQNKCAWGVPLVATRRYSQAGMQMKKKVRPTILSSTHPPPNKLSPKFS